jgi:hypothetical protein
MKNLPPSSVDILEIWEPQTPGTLRAMSEYVQGLLYIIKIKSLK